MHEWALAEAVVVTAEQTAKEKKYKVIEEVAVHFGALQQIDQEIFGFALKELFESAGPLFTGVKVRMQKDKAVFECRKCAHQWDFAGRQRRITADAAEAIHFVPEVAHVHLQCPECKSPDFKILQGRGVSVGAIKGKEDL